MLNVDLTRVLCDGLAGAALIEHQVVERHRGLLVALGVVGHRWLWLCAGRRDVGLLAGRDDDIVGQAASRTRRLTGQVLLRH